MSILMDRRLLALVWPLMVGQFVVLGALWPVLPINPDISVRYAIVSVIIIFGVTMHLSNDGGRVLMLAVAFASLSALVPILTKGYDSVFISIVLSIMLGYLAYRYCPPPGILLWFIGGLNIFLIMYFLVKGDLNDVFYREAGTDLIGVSRNYIGILLLQQYLVYYALCHRVGSSPRHWPLFLMPIIAVMSAGVGSTLACLAALGGYLILQLKIRPIYGFSVAFAVILFFAPLLGLVEGTVLFDRLESGRFVISREILWRDFFSQLDETSVWVGFTKEVGFFDHRNSLEELQNLHNSYLNLYRHLGLFSLPYIIIIAYTAFALLLRNTMLGWLYLCALLRAFSDGYFFSSFLTDFILFFLFFLTPWGARFLFNKPKRIVAASS